MCDNVKMSFFSLSLIVVSKCTEVKGKGTNDSRLVFVIWNCPMSVSFDPYSGSKMYTRYDAQQNRNY